MKQKVNLKWYLLRWFMFWAELLTSIISIITFGAWQPTWNMKMENIFLDYTEKINFNKH